VCGGSCFLLAQESKFWKLFKEDPPRCAVVLRTSLGLVHLLTTLLEPFMPSFSQKVRQYRIRST